MIPPPHRGRGEQHREEQKSAAEKDGGKEAILSSPRRSRSTPMNHKKAMPANGTRFSARAIVLELAFSQAPASSGSARTESRNHKRTAIRRTENWIPARGVFKRARIKSASGFINSLQGIVFEIT
jgi:hypothetical protein